jgi:regulator of sigma D
MSVECNDRLASAQCSVVSYLVKLNKAIDADHSDLVQALVSRFCDELIDYIAYTQYRVLRHCSIPVHHSAAIDRITRQVVGFNDRWGSRLDIDIAALKADLEQLAFDLETRFEIEDELTIETFAATA